MMVAVSGGVSSSANKAAAVRASVRLAATGTRTSRVAAIERGGVFVETVLVGVKRRRGVQGTAPCLKCGFDLGRGAVEALPRP